ncbi:IS3 family transposase [Parafrankia sp. FMc2]
MAEYIDWYNHRRLHGEISMVPPAEYEADYTATQNKIENARQPSGA